MEKKKCSKCKVEQELSQYTKLKTSKDGLNYSCKSCNAIRGKKYREENYDKILKRINKWRRDNVEWTRAKNERYRKRYPEKLKEIRSKWEEKNPHKKKEYRKNHKSRNRERRKERQLTDSTYIIVNNIRSRLHKYLNKLKITKRNKTFDIVGCSPQELKEHLEKQFKDGMSWENRSEWHIDHIIPLSSATTEEELYKLCHYTNLQPLWAIDNIKKGGKIL